MWRLFHKIQSLGKHVSIPALTGPERKESAENASVKRLSIKGEKKLKKIFGLVNVRAIKPDGVIKICDCNVITNGA